MTARIVIISGPPGAGKSSVARAMAEQSEQPRAVHLHTDDFYAYIRKGYLAPWLPEAHAQNVTVTESLTAATEAYARGEFEVLVDGVVGPWLIEPWTSLARRGCDVRYVVLRPDEASTVSRAMSRSHPLALKDENVVRTMWGYFANLGAFEPHVLDTTNETLPKTIAKLKAMLAGDRFRLR